MEELVNAASVSTLSESAAARKIPDQSDGASVTRNTETAEIVSGSEKATNHIERKDSIAKNETESDQVVDSSEVVCQTKLAGDHENEDSGGNASEVSVDRVRACFAHVT